MKNSLNHNNNNNNNKYIEFYIPSIIIIINDDNNNHIYVKHGNNDNIDCDAFCIRQMHIHSHRYQFESAIILNSVILFNSNYVTLLLLLLVLSWC